MVSRTGYTGEPLCKEELESFLGCSEMETRAISGQMANGAVFC